MSDTIKKICNLFEVNKLPYKIENGEFIFDGHIVGLDCDKYIWDEIVRLMNKLLCTAYLERDNNIVIHVSEK